MQQHLISVGDKHHAPRMEVLEKLGEGVLFTMETRDGEAVVRCFATHAAISALQGRLDGNILSVFAQRRLIFEEIAAKLYDMTRENPVVINGSTVEPLTRVLR